MFISKSTRANKPGPGEIPFGYQTFGELEEELAETVSWFEGIGLQVSGTRLADLQGELHILFKDQRTLPAYDLLEKWHEHDTYDLLFDAASFVRIAQEIGKVGQHALPKKDLRTILEGPLRQSEEDPGGAGVNARNIAAHFELAAHISGYGLGLLGFKDLSFRFEHTDFYVESKRLHSHGNVKENFENAQSQLLRKMPKDSDRGIVALVIDRLTEAKHKAVTVEGVKDLDNAVSHLVGRFCERHGRFFVPGVDTRIIGIAFILRALALYKPEQLVISSYHLLLQPQAHDWAERRRLERLAALMRD